MLDDFFIRALVAGVGIAAVSAPLGCFIIWRRMAYFGETLAHSALLGIALAMLLDIHIILGVFTISVTGAMALVVVQRRGVLPTDSLLGILSHSTLALGLVLVSLMTSIRIDLMGYLFGDILAVSRFDIAILYAGGIAVIITIWRIWQPLIAATVNAELAAAEGMDPEKMRLVFMVLVAAVIAIAIKIVGILLITSLLIIPAAAARRFAQSPERMAVVAGMIGTLSVVVGLFGSLHLDTPSGPSIVVSAMLLFLTSLAHRGTAVEPLNHV